MSAMRVPPSGPVGSQWRSCGNARFDCAHAFVDHGVVVDPRTGYASGRFGGHCEYRESMSELVRRVTLDRARGRVPFPDRARCACPGFVEVRR